MHYNIQKCALCPIFNISNIYAFKPPIVDDIAAIGVSRVVDC